MNTRFRFQLIVSLLMIVGVTLAARFSSDEPTTTKTNEIYPVAEFGLDPDAPPLELLSPEDQEAAIEQAMLNMWQWAPSPGGYELIPMGVTAENGMIAFRKLPEDLFFFTNPNVANPAESSYLMATSLVNIHHLELSPDEKSIAFVGRIEGGETYCVYRANLDTRDYSSVVCGFEAAYEPRWSPDGNRLVFSGRMPGEENTQVWFVSSNGGEPTEIAAALTIAEASSWQDNNTILLAGRLGDRAWAIYSVAVNTPEAAIPITPEFNPSNCEGTFASGPEISPTGNLVVFAAVYAVPTTKSSYCAAAVYTVDPDPITTNPPDKQADIASLADSNHASYGWLRWNPQGDHIGIMGTGDNNIQRLFIIDIVGETNESKVLNTIQGGNFSQLDWSPDGTQIAVGHSAEGDQWKLYIVDWNADTFTEIERGVDPAWSSRAPHPKVDLEATGLEVTQAIQNADNSVPLVERKSTWVRLSVKSNSGQVNNVSARLTITRDGVESHLNPANRRINVTTAGSDRGNENTTFNFLIPIEWSTGEIGIRAEVGHGPQFPEDNYDNNVYPRTDDMTLTFYPTTSISVDVYFIEWIKIDGSTHTAPADAANVLIQYLQWTYPLADDGVTLVMRGDTITVREDQINFHSVNDWFKVLAKLNCNATDNNRCWGLIPMPAQPIPNDFWGVGDANKKAALSAADFPSDETYGRDLRGLIAHEFGHTYGLCHDSDKYPNCPSYDDDYACERIDDYGSQGTSHLLTLYSPEKTYNFMNPSGFKCGVLRRNQWITIKNYKGLFEKFRQKEARSIDSQTTYLVAIGTVSAEPSGVIANVYDQSRVDDVDDYSGSGPYRIELLDGEGAVLFTRYFSGYHADGQAPSDILGFIEFMPRPEGLARIALWDGNTKLDERVASPNAPEIQLLTSLDGIQIEDPFEITWMASDADDDPLNYVVEYSSDGGSMWQSMAVNLVEQSYVVDPAYLPGTTQGKIRVRVSDGLNTAESVSDGTFSVPLHDPIVNILSPNPGRHANWLHVDLVATAYDYEDGQLQDSAFAWSIDGEPVGEDSIISLFDLADGKHAITLTVTDSDGQTAAVEVVITMTGLPYNQFLPISVDK